MTQTITLSASLYQIASEELATAWCEEQQGLVSSGEMPYFLPLIDLGFTIPEVARQTAALL